MAALTPLLETSAPFHMCNGKKEMKTCCSSEIKRPIYFSTLLQGQFKKKQKQTTLYENIISDTGREYLTVNFTVH